MKVGIEWAPSDGWTSGHLLIGIIDLNCIPGTAEDDEQRALTALVLKYRECHWR